MLRHDVPTENPSNRLAVLAAEIRAAHEDANGTSEYSVQRAVDAGRGLAEAKQQEDRYGNLIFQTGADWRSWVEGEARIPYSTAQYYIQLIVGIEDRVLTSEVIARIGQRAALKLIAAAGTRARREASRNAKPLPDGAELRIGDCREVLADVPDNSVPLILTDPPYEDTAEPLWRWLGPWARRVLIPGGALVVYFGGARINLLYRILDDAGLKHWWPCAMMHDQSQRLAGKFVIAQHKPILWYVKDFRRGRTLVPDVVSDSVPDKSEHNWAQGDGGIRVWIHHLTEPGEIIVDPFAGTGEWGRITADAGRFWLGSDIEEGGTETVMADETDIEEAAE